MRTLFDSLPSGYTRNLGVRDASVQTIRCSGVLEMRRIGSRVSGLLIGVLLLTAGGFWATSAMRVWKASWRERQYRATHQKSVPLIDPALAADSSVAPAQLKVIGPLANSMQVL